LIEKKTQQTIDFFTLSGM